MEVGDSYFTILLTSFQIKSGAVEQGNKFEAALLQRFREPTLVESIQTFHFDYMYPNISFSKLSRDMSKSILDGGEGVHTAQSPLGPSRNMDTSVNDLGMLSGFSQ